MTDVEFCLFETAIGPCGIAWGARGVVLVQLPEADAERTRARVRRRRPEAREAPAPAPVAQAIADITALLRGEPADLTGVQLDMDGVPDFHRRLYEAARTIPAGRTLTYGELAARIDEPGGARVVGEAMGRNPFAIIVPCHRVVAAGGKLGGFSAGGGATTKQRMLAIERARPAGTPDLFDALG